MGLSQEALGELAGVHHTKIGRIENGKRELKTGFLRQLAGIFRVPASAILDVNPSTPEGRKTATMLQTWDRLTDEQRDTVLRMVTALALTTKRDAAS